MRLNGEALQLHKCEHKIVTLKEAQWEGVMWGSGRSVVLKLISGG